MIKKIDELFRLFLQSEYRVTQRAAWPLSYCAIAHPHLMENNYEELLDNLKKPIFMIQLKEIPSVSSIGKYPETK